MKLIRLTDDQLEYLQNHISDNLVVIRDELDHPDEDDREGYEEADYDFVREIGEALDAALEEKSVLPEGSPADPVCPGCGCKSGEGLTEGCNDPGGCGFWRRLCAE